MARNVEIKARLDDFQDAVARAEQICGATAKLIQQEDIFFHCRSGRLKLRVFTDKTAELIAYHRPDQLGPKTSKYVISPVPDPESMKLALLESNGVRAVVRKTRHLFLAGRTRIHLDQVDDLGDFLELEVVLKTDDDESQGVAEAYELMRQLNVSKESLVEEAYVDLLEAQETAR